MKKLWISLVTAFFIGFTSLGLVASHVDAEEGEGVNDVELTEEQKNEMAELQRNVIDQHKEIVDKYVEFGVIDEEKGEKIKTHLEENYKMLEENDFVPNWDHRHQKDKDKQEDE
ncbi:YckD family protein [Alkalibacillus aidingensis]|uniref:YckD family protein n=1 Tax=Alkalibacillus aidingensis TaxID=2747607 RepID=UPI0016612DE2|nr:YckD family protein [Alkalibacillus aidingensis]